MNFHDESELYRRAPHDPVARRAAVQHLIATIHRGLLVRTNERITPELAEERARNIATVIASELGWL